MSLRARPLALTLLWLVSGALLGARTPQPEEAPETRVWLWAWERPENLRFLEGRRDVGVAFLARTIVVAGDRVTVRPRRNPLFVHPRTPLTAVIRVESSRGIAPSQSTFDTITAEASAVLASAHTNRLQIDFDARASEIPYYRAMLARLRTTLPVGTSLGITALAAWCADSRSWLGDPPPVDEIVPMVFSMGLVGSRVRVWLAAGGEFPVEACRAGFGFSTAEPVNVPIRAHVLHVFSPVPWSPDPVSNLPLWNRP